MPIFRNNKPLLKYLTDRKSKISAVFIFEIEVVKKDKMFNFIKGRFSIIGSQMDMIFGVFSEIYMRLVKSIISHFFQDIAKAITI